MAIFHLTRKYVIFTPLVGPAIDMKIVMKTTLRRWIKMVKDLPKDGSRCF
jgi:hypothetical protein